MNEYMIMSKIDLESESECSNYLSDSLSESSNTSFESLSSTNNNDYTQNDLINSILNNNDSFSDDDFISQLKFISIKYAVSHNYMTELLKLLTKKGINCLPSTAKTFFKTFSKNTIHLKSNVEYYFFGVANMITKYTIKYLKHYISENVDQYIHISINIDGLPLFKSSSKSMWPILFAIHIRDSFEIVFPVALTLGTKPSNLDFIEDTVNELNALIINNIIINNTLFKIIIYCIVCDATAKSFIKSTKQFNGYYGCDRCD